MPHYATYGERWAVGMIHPLFSPYYF